jgi:uncharacterized membrane protein
MKRTVFSLILVACNSRTLSAWFLVETRTTTWFLVETRPRTTRRFSLKDSLAGGLEARRKPSTVSVFILGVILHMNTIADWLLACRISNMQAL